MKKKRILHFSTHGRLNLPKEIKSHLLGGLLLYKEKDKEEEILYSEDIQNFDLKETELVVLSACETLKGNINSDGISGLVRAFFTSGVTSVIGSLWNIGEYSTYKLLTNFYKYLINEKKTKIESLRLSILDNMNEFGKDNILNWGGFVLYGIFNDKIDEEFKIKTDNILDKINNNINNNIIFEIKDNNSIIFNIDEKYLQLQAYLMNINRTESFFSQPGHQYLPMMQELLTELEQEQHTLAMTGKASTIIYGKDSVTPKMQPVVRIPAKDQHERFLEDTLIYINKWLNLVTPIDENYLFKMNKDQFDTFLDASGISDENKTIFYTSLKSAEKFREYQRKPKLQVNLDNNSVVEVSMNDSIDIPSQALMIITDETNATETNRPVNLISGYRALSAILSKYYAGENQDIILSNLAYTQASSTPSMCHFHLVPAYNSEGKFIIPYLDSNVDEVDCYKDTCIDGVEVPHEESDHRFNLVKFKIKLDSDEAVNVRRFEAINQKLQKWETQTGCDMTWVAKFSAKQNTVVMCVELRAGINQFTLNQIDDFNRRQLWGKIGFTEVMGKKYSMLTQSNLNNAVYIFNHLPQLRETMLNTPLYCLQVSPDDKKTFYNFEDIEVSSEQIEAKTSKSFIHIARLLQAYDADIFTKTMAEMYRLHEDELNELKDILNQYIPCRDSLLIRA